MQASVTYFVPAVWPFLAYSILVFIANLLLLYVSFGKLRGAKDNVEVEGGIM
jgi:hypothetical protein